MIAPMTGEPKTVAMAANAALAASTTLAWSGMFFPGQPDSQDRQAAAEGDERSLGSQHETQAQGGQRGEQDAGQFGWLGGAGLDPLVGDVTAVTRQPHDRDGGQHPGDSEYGKRPPPRDGMQAQPAGQALVHLLLNPVHQLQEAPRGERDQHPDQRGEHEQDPVALAPDRRTRIGGSGSRRTHRGTCCLA